MPPSLDPLVAERLRAFAQRWTRMVWVRGLCAAAVTLLAAFTVLAWLDRLAALAERTRWLLSFGGYAATAMVFWFVAGRRLMNPPTPRELAARLEKAWPGLRNQVVAAVELAEGSADGQHDSSAFRDLMQEGVARRMRDLRMDAVLPRSLVAPWTRSAIAMFALVAAMLAVPALEFPRQLARALAPMADIERVARTKIRVIEPAAEVRWLAQGDHQAVVVELAGASADRAELEVVAADGRAERWLMSPGQRGQFAATVPVGAGAFEFRVRAGDAVTKPVKLPTRARPAVVAFVKTIEAPAYAQLPVRHAEEDHGNVSALEGSTLDLRMRLNQPVRAGELALIAAGRTNRIPLTAPAPEVVHARIPLSGAASYQVHLVAAETGLANKFYPTFELQVQPDLAPRITMDSPRSDLVVAPDEVLTVQGSAGDDIGLAAVAQQYQVNGGPWVEVPMHVATRTNTPLVRRWDLLLLGLATGDRVATRLVAVDARGSRAESALALLTIGAEQSDSTRGKSLAARQQVREALDAAAKSAADLRAAYGTEAVGKIRAGDDVQRQQTAAGAAVALGETERHLNRAEKQLAAALREADPGREAAELALLNSALSAARRDLLPRAQADREALAREAHETPERSQVGEAVKSAQRLADFTSQLATQFNELVAADHADALTERFDRMMKEQQRAGQIAEHAGTDAREWQRVARREGAVTRETEQADQQLSELRQRGPKSVADRLAKTQEQLRAARSQVEGALKQPAGPELAAPVRQLKAATEQAAGDLRTTARELGMRADKARAELAKLTEGSADKVARLRRDLEQLAASEKRLADARQAGEDAARLKLKADTDRDRAEAAWNTAMEQLGDRARAEETRQDGDPQFAAQLGQTRDSLANMRAAAGADSQGPANLERLASMEKALRALEAGRQLSELESAAQALARQERFEGAAPDATTSRPRDWSWMEKQTTAVQREARSAGLGERAVNALSDAVRSEAGREISREMAARRSGQRTAQPMAEQLDQLAGQFRAAQTEAARAQAEARQALAGAVPKLSERLLAQAQLAAELAGDIQRGTSATAGAVLTNWHSRQLTLNARLGDTASALRRDGSAQDLTQPAGRARARDAEMAVELLREPPVQAEAALRGAIESRGMARANLLGDAARHERELASRLGLLAEHFRQLEAGNAEATRAELRKQEDALGARATQDERFGQMERWQRLASLPPDQLRRELAAELQRNPAMREELGRLSRDAVGAARQRMQEAAENERALARQLERSANPALEQGELWEQLRLLVEAMRKTAQVDIPAAQAGAEKLRVTGAEDFSRSAAFIAESADRAPTQTNQPPATVAQRVAEMASPLQRAMNELAQIERRLTEAERKFTEAQKKLPEAQRDLATAGEWAAGLARGTAVTAAARRYMERVRALAEAFANSGRTSPEQALARAAQQQGEVANQLREAAADLQRAGRNAEAMGNPAEAAALEQSAQQAQASANLADRARRGAQEGQQSPAQVGQNAAQMGNVIEQQANRLGAASNSSNSAGQQGSAVATGQQSNAQPGNQPGNANATGQRGRPPSAGRQSSSQSGSQSGQSGQGSASSGNAGQPNSSQSGNQGSASPEAAQSGPMLQPGGRMSGDGSSAIAGGRNVQPEARWMARAVDELNGGGNTAGTDAARAIAAAQQAQHQAFRRAETSGQGRSGGVEAGAAVPGATGAGRVGGPARAGTAGNFTPLPSLGELRDADWAKLPPKLAQDLREAQLNSVAGDYRPVVEAYFKVLAERARK